MTEQSWTAAKNGHRTANRFVKGLNECRAYIFQCQLNAWSSKSLSIHADLGRIDLDVQQRELAHQPRRKSCTFQPRRKVFQWQKRSQGGAKNDVKHVKCISLLVDACLSQYGGFFAWQQSLRMQKAIVSCNNRDLGGDKQGDNTCSRRRVPT